MIINAHNFTPLGFDPSVNGKTPSSVWCPSRDTAGNGTTTLNDLVGSNNGTLTSMDPATDWVSDIDAGGVRSLDFDGVNDRVECGTTAGNFGSGDWSISIWVKPPNSSICKSIVSKRLNANPFTQWQIFHGHLDASSNPVPSKSISLFIYNGVAFTSPNLQHYRTTSDVIDGNWMHVVVVRKADTTPKIYTNGVDRALTAVRTGNFDLNANNNAKLCLANTDGNVSPYQCRLDDVRLFAGIALDSTDVSDLYGAQRGGNAI